MTDLFSIHKAAIFVLSVALLICSTGYAEHIPASENGAPMLLLRTAGILKSGNLTSLIEITGNFKAEQNPLGYRSMTAGAYYRLHRNVKAGLFYRLQAGAIHDDDWKWLNPGWEWEDTGDRYEHNLITDITPRFLLHFLPGEHWVFSWKNRYEYNFFNGHQSVYSRPGLTWFYMKDRTPVLSFLFQYGVYFPLNFSESVIYEHSPYIGVIYHRNSHVGLEFTAALKNTVWSTSSDIPLSGEPGYTTVNRNIIIGIGFIYTPGN